MRPVYIIDVLKNVWDVKGNVITSSTKSVLLEVLHAAISYFAPYLARSKHSRHNTNIIVEITGPDINVYDTRKTLWPIGQEHVDKSGRVTFKARGFFNQINETKYVTHIR